MRGRGCSIPLSIALILSHPLNAPPSPAPPTLTPFSSQGCAVVIGRFAGCLCDNVDASELHMLHNSAHAQLSVSKGADTDFLPCGLGPARSGSVQGSG